jgi:hypothetical protein
MACLGSPQSGGPSCRAFFHKDWSSTPFSRPICLKNSRHPHRGGEDADDGASGRFILGFPHPSAKLEGETWPWGKHGLIKVPAFRGALLSHWTWLLILAPAEHSPSPLLVAFPDQPVLGVGLSDSCPSTASA